LAADIDLVRAMNLQGINIMDIMNGRMEVRPPAVPQVRIPELQDGVQPLAFHARFTKTVKPTKVFDTYWRFACERQRIFFRRLSGAPHPWTDDPILGRHRFTNAYRASDRVSQFLIAHVIEGSDQTPDDIFFRILLFKIFNRIATWRLLEKSLGGIHAHEFEPHNYDAVLAAAMHRGERIYSAAYIMPAPRLGAAKKHTNHLRLLARMLSDGLPEMLARSRSMEHAYRLLLAYPSIGSFLAYQYVIDLNYSQLLNFSEMDFVVPGPGAVDGIHKCFRDLDGLSQGEVIREVTEHAGEEFDRRGLDFTSLWGRPLQLIDCQNLFCEVSKYARLAHPEVKGTSSRARIKQRYRPDPQPLAYRYPAKWKLDVDVRTPTGIRS
jgi:hypothetical protein